MNFPQYRKYLNGKSYFKIISLQQAEELKISSTFYEMHTIEAKILPDRNFIMDLLQNFATFAITIDEKEYTNMLLYCETQLKKIEV